MEDKRVYACFLVHGAPVYARFDDDAEYENFVGDIDFNVEKPQLLTALDGKQFRLRPSAVDAIFKGARPSGN